MDLLAFTPGLWSIPIRMGVWPRGSYLRPASSKARSPAAPARKPGPAVTDSQVI